jgi:hypothetical protein
MNAAKAMLTKPQQWAKLGPPCARRSLGLGLPLIKRFQHAFEFGFSDDFSDGSVINVWRNWLGILGNRIRRYRNNRSSCFE